MDEIQYLTIMLSETGLCAKDMIQDIRNSYQEYKDAMTASEDELEAEKEGAGGGLGG